MAYRPLGDILVANGSVNRDAVEAALRKQTEGGGSPKVGKILIEAGAAQPREILHALSEQCDLPVCPHEKPAEHLFLEEHLPFPFMVEHRVLFQTLEDSLCAITDDPSDWSSIEAARLHHGEALPVYLVSDGQMDEALEKVQAFAEKGPGEW